MHAGAALSALMQVLSSAVLGGKSKRMSWWLAGGRRCPCGPLPRPASMGMLSFHARLLLLLLAAAAPSAQPSRAGPLRLA